MSASIPITSSIVVAAATQEIMMSGGPADAFDEWASRPFFPDHMRGNGSGTEVGERVAYALEYIAAQLGEISRKMDHIGSGFSASKEDFESMNDLLKRL